MSKKLKPRIGGEFDSVFMYLMNWYYRLSLFMPFILIGVLIFNYPNEPSTFIIKSLLISYLNFFIAIIICIVISDGEVY